MTDRPDVLLVVLDSARKDRLSTYGHNRETTPAFDELADGATVYENAFTPAPWTLPSHCSLFTGRFPSEHGVTNGFTDRSLRLPADLQTIPEVLAERGYRTAGFSNNPWVGALSGLDRGFETFVEWDLEISRSSGFDHRPRERLYSRLHTLLGRAAGQPHALLKRRFFTSELVDRAGRWLGETAGEQAFTFLNLMEAHSPYYPPGLAFRQLGLEPPGAVESRVLNARLLAYVMGRSDLDETQRERVLEFYDASLRFQDAKLRELVDVLRDRDLFDDTLLVVCADHGKTLGEYDRDGVPPHYVRDVNVNVPLLVKHPGQQHGERVTEPVQLTGLYDLVLRGERGSLLTSGEGALVEDYVPHTGRSAAEVDRWRILADATHKYVHDQQGREYLFARVDGERAVDSPELLDRYRELLDERVAAHDVSETAESGSAESETEVRRAVERQLEDLGYLD